MSQTEFQIGDRCLCSFSSDKNIPVEIVADFKKNTYWVTPDNHNYRCDYASHEDMIGGKYVFVTHVDYLMLVERPVEDDGAGVDISTLI